MMEKMLYDMTLFLASTVLLIAYQLFLHLKGRKSGSATFKSAMSRSRAAWVRAVMDGGKDVLAVQTFRNSIMAATFMATTALLLITGVLTLSADGEKMEKALRALNFAGAFGPELWMTKMVLMLVPLFTAFFSFTMCVRYTHHIGYMINVPVSGKYGPSSPDLVISQMERSAQFYWLGMRSYFYLVPLVFWLFGPHFMLAATVVLIAVMYTLDSLPDFPQAAEENLKEEMVKPARLVSVG